MMEIQVISPVNLNPPALTSKNALVFIFGVGRGSQI